MKDKQFEIAQQTNGGIKLSMNHMPIQLLTKESPELYIHDTIAPSITLSNNQTEIQLYNKDAAKRLSNNGIAISVAIVKLQAIVRGFMQRLRYQLMVLESKLESIETQRRRALVRIKKLKRRKYKDCRTYVELKTNPAFSTLRNAKELIGTLMKQNQRLVVQQRGLHHNLMSEEILCRHLERTHLSTCRNLVRREIDLMALQQQNAVANAVLQNYSFNIAHTQSQLMQYTTQESFSDLIRQQMMIYNQMSGSEDNLHQRQIMTADVAV